MSDAPHASSRRDPVDVAKAYFACMCAGDHGVVDLFHDDARLVGLGKTTEGKPAIREFYRGIIAGAGPTPRIIGDPLVAGARVAVEIEISLDGGATVHAVDLFEIEDGRIRSLGYFLAAS
jgi:hypothetical protein